ncbi:MAG: DUF4013 domain-containing protein [Cyanobacteria bacterium J06632_22]
MTASVRPLTQALRYPWQGKGWFYRLLPLALLQLVPVIGQIILMGYGQAIARAVYRQQRDLPRLHLRRALIDGLRLAAIGIVYCLPIILTVLLVLSGDSMSNAETSGSIPGIVYPIVLLSYSRISSEIVKRRPTVKSAVSFVNRIFSFLVVLFIIWRLSGLFTLLKGGVDFSDITLTSTDIVMLFVSSLLLSILVAAWLISGVQFAITGKGLLNPRATLKRMMVNRGLTLRFTLSTWLLIAGTAVTTMASALFLLVPGLVLLTAGNAAIWYLATQYAKRVGILERGN